jgi:Cu-Zn family superoxide dismutase
MSITRKLSYPVVAVAVSFAAIALVSCQPAPMETEEMATPPAETVQAASAWEGVDQLVATLDPVAESGVAGVVHFRATDSGVEVSAEIDGLNPGQMHGFHIHEFGDCTAADATSAGGHYNPGGDPHALPPAMPRHAGDLGNVQADESGHASFQITVDNITLAGPDNPIVGRGLIVHAGTDDGSQPTGAAGARIACGVIGVAASDQ